MKDKRWVALEIAQLTGADSRTVAKWLDGKLNNKPLGWAFGRAARELRIVADVDAVRVQSDAAEALSA